MTVRPLRLALLALLALQLMPVQAQELPPPQDKTRDIAPSDDPDATESTTTQVPLDEIRRYVSVYNAVRQA